MNKFGISALFDDSSRSRTLFDDNFLMMLSTSCSFNDEKSTRSRYAQKSSFELRSMKFVEENFEKNFLVNKRVFFCFFSINDSFERSKIDVKT